MMHHIQPLWEKLRGLERRVGKLERQERPVGTDWTPPVLQNGWVNFNATDFESAGYRRSAAGDVQLKGTIKDGTTAASTVLFTLPAGHRPAKTRIFPVVSNNALGQVRVFSSGAVAIYGGSNVWLALDGIAFKADA